MKKSRREFIKQSAIATAGLTLVTPLSENLFASSKRFSPSDRINVALIGTRNKGFGILKNHLSFPEVHCVGLCDVDENLLNQRAADVEKDYSQKPKLYKDYRKLLENKDIDAVIIGTPDHWHCLPLITACELGKDVYVEKPMANSIEECNIMARAANKYNRIVQVGQQQRSGESWRAIMKEIHSGRLGKLRKVEIWANFNYGVGQKMVPDSPIPIGVDYEFWQGPAPRRNSFNKTRFHGSWRMFWDYGGGLMTDWGVHLIDMALWAGNVTDDPTTILSYGKNISYKDYNHETFDTMSVTFPQDNYVITWEHVAGTQNGPWDMLYGLNFICDDASIVANRSGWKILPEWDSDKKEFKLEKSEHTLKKENHDLHTRNFLDCIKSREKPICPPEIGRQVALYAHAANIAARTGEYRLDWDKKKNKFTNSVEANKYIVPEYTRPWELPNL